MKARCMWLERRTRLVCNEGQGWLERRARRAPGSSSCGRGGDGRDEAAMKAAWLERRIRRDCDEGQGWLERRVARPLVFVVRQRWR